MKRRVLNAATNKKALRQCSAMSGARSPFRVLCDSSFLRVAFDYFRHYRKAGESITNKRELEATLPSLETLFTELFGTQQYFLQTTLESQEQFQATYLTSHSNTGAKKFQQQQELEKQMLSAPQGALTPAPKPAKQPSHAPNPKAVADAQIFLRKFELIGSSVYAEYAPKRKTTDEVAGDKVPEKRNEQKAIIATLKEIVQSQKKSSQGGTSNHPLSSYFVATLNHDMRALLKAGEAAGNTPIPTIRMTFNPWLLWLEAGEISASQTQKIAQEAPPAQQAPAFKNISNKADKAFLAHLTKESTKVASAVSARERFMSSGHGGRLRKPADVSAQQQSKVGRKPPMKGQPAVANSNPLSKKPKRQRETIVSEEEGNKPSKNHRPESKK